MRHCGHKENADVSCYGDLVEGGGAEEGVLRLVLDWFIFGVSILLVGSEDALCERCDKVGSAGTDY